MKTSINFGTFEIVHQELYGVQIITDFDTVNFGILNPEIASIGMETADNLGLYLPCNPSKELIDLIGDRPISDYQIKYNKYNDVLLTLIFGHLDPIDIHFRIRLRKGKHIVVFEMNDILQASSIVVDIQPEDYPEYMD